VNELLEQLRRARSRTEVNDIEKKLRETISVSRWRFPEKPLADSMLSSELESESMSVADLLARRPLRSPSFMGAQESSLGEFLEATSESELKKRTEKIEEEVRRLSRELTLLHNMLSLIDRRGWLNEKGLWMELGRIPLVKAIRKLSRADYGSEDIEKLISDLKETD
jgi:hypothetical protein